MWGSHINPEGVKQLVFLKIKSEMLVVLIIMDNNHTTTTIMASKFRSTDRTFSSSSGTCKEYLG